MADEAKRTGGEPDYDTDRAWARFEKLASREPVPAFWRQLETERRTGGASNDAARNEDINEDEKDGAVLMKQSEHVQSMQGASAVAGTGAAYAGAAIGRNGAWRTERPAKRRLRRLTVGAAAAVVAIGLFATPAGDRVLAAMQQTFRIQHLVGVSISADDLTAISDVLERGSPEGDRSFNLAQYGTLSQSGGGENRSLDWNEAERRMGSPLHRLEESGPPSYQPATTLTFELNVKAVNRLFARLGSKNFLPAEADGQAIRLFIPDGVSAEGSLSGRPVRLLQFGKPELTMEDGIDAEAVRKAILELPVMPDSLRTKLAAIGDWRNTLPVPAYDGVSANLKLGGHDAILTEDGNRRYLIWLEGDRINMLSGAEKDFPTESDFRKAAEELVRP
ncbi:hypothetical protein H7B90_20165 [Cohnella xylanilytica]|uniref:DUF4367 domain-containing protein n=1 Tax=Cohnella xylanilytica TaxID=557555 RepID=A0A841TZQ6_9BACL|nr:hypothetical protein [Cohnella xylanilytica]MBB6693715.1 hypothetical protein [Cohnella xylanilytica]